MTWHKNLTWEMLTITGKEVDKNENFAIIVRNSSRKFYKGM